MERTGTQISGKRCADLLGLTALPEQAQPLPFDQMRAHRLYKSLFGELEDLIKGKRLLVVPSGALTQLPFQVLVKSASANGDHRSAAWLVRDLLACLMPTPKGIRLLGVTLSGLDNDETDGGPQMSLEL